jgi:ribosomal protein S3
MGFKMIFKGRFSRKDRASKMVLLMGKVPLNNININVDYNLITMPIKNSAISIKVFIYRIPVVQKYKNIVII